MNPLEIFNEKENILAQSGATNKKQKTATVEVSNIFHEKKKSKNGNIFKNQYHQLYKKRLSTLSFYLKERLEDEVILYESITSMDIDNEVWVIANIHKLFKNNDSYLKVLEDPRNRHLYPGIEPFGPSEDDKIYIEDVTGKREIDVDEAELELFVGYTINENVKDYLINGMTVALQGILNSKNIFVVKKIVLPGISKISDGSDGRMVEENLCDDEIGDLKILKERINKGDDVNLVALVSGLEVNIESFPHMKQVSMLFDDLKGVFDNKGVINSISSTLIIGDSINVNEGINLSLVGSYAHESSFSKMFETVIGSLKILDSALESVSKKQTVMIFPGEKDPADSFLPQKPLSRAMFHKTWKSRQDKVKFCSNPSTVHIEKKKFIVTSGQNIRDAIFYTPVNHFIVTLLGS